MTVPDRHTRDPAPINVKESYEWPVWQGAEQLALAASGPPDCRHDPVLKRRPGRRAVCSRPAPPAWALAGSPIYNVKNVICASRPRFVIMCADFTNTEWVP